MRLPEIPAISDESIQDYVALCDATDPIEAFDLFLRRNIPAAWLTHYLRIDNDNEAELVRRVIRGAMTVDRALAVLAATERYSVKDNQTGEWI
jgi:hypothetical protein